MFRTLCSCIGAAGAMVAVGLADADPIDLDDFSGSETVVDFDPGFQFSTNYPIIYDGVEFSESGGGTGGAGLNGSINWGTYFDNIPGGSAGIGMNDSWGDSVVRMVLPDGMRRVGVLCSTTPVTSWTLNAYDASNNLLESVTGTMPNTSEAVFIGVERSEVIAYIELVETNGENGNISLFDDLRFEAGGPSLSTSGSCPGSMTFTSAGNTANGNVAFAYAFGTGAFVIPSGPCAGTQTGLNATIQLGGMVSADGSGTAELTQNVPAAACGRVFVQTVDAATCATSNVVGI